MLKILFIPIFFLLVSCGPTNVIHPSAKNLDPGATSILKVIAGDKRYTQVVIAGLYEKSSLKKYISTEMGAAMFGTEPNQITVPPGNYIAMVRCDTRYSIPINSIEVSMKEGMVYTITCIPKETNPYIELQIKESPMF